MLTEDIMCTLMGPIPTPFTGDLAQAQQFLDEFGQLDRANWRHFLITQPKLRVELALTLIVGPETEAWKSTVRRGRPAEETDELVWDEFFDSFCTAWIDDAPMTPTILSAPRQYPPSPTVSLLPHADEGKNEEVLPDSTTISLPMTLPTPADKPLAPVTTDPPLTVLVNTLSTRSVFDSPPPRSPRCPSSPRIAPSPLLLRSFGMYQSDLDLVTGLPSPTVVCLQYPVGNGQGDTQRVTDICKAKDEGKSEVDDDNEKSNDL
ncbi:hypothetical protein EDB86DRAFT_3079537 [Lactarius hatsudake]|nr:hypothetical protein EDB86DRAFT_3079537 [Lactarius hatsudake]